MEKAKTIREQLKGTPGERRECILGTVEDRLERLERMIIRALLCVQCGSGKINRDSFIPEAQAVLRNHFAEHSTADDYNERTWTEDAVLLLLREEISAERKYREDAETKRATIERDRKRKEAEARKAEADEAARIAQEEIDALNV